MLEVKIKKLTKKAKPWEGGWQKNDTLSIKEIKLRPVLERNFTMKINKLILAGVFSFLIVVSVHSSEANPIGDIDGSGTVGFNDILALAHVALGAPCPKSSICDLNGNGIITSADVNIEIRLVNKYRSQYDINGNGIIDIADVNALRDINRLKKDCPVNKVCDIDGDGQITCNDEALLNTLVFEYLPLFDLNNDHVIDNKDVGVLLSKIFSGGSIADIPNKVLDINGDGEVDLNDVIALQKLANEPQMKF